MRHLLASDFPNVAGQVETVPRDLQFLCYFKDFLRSLSIRSRHPSSFERKKRHLVILVRVSEYRALDLHIPLRGSLQELRPDILPAPDVGRIQGQIFHNTAPVAGG